MKICSRKIEKKTKVTKVFWFKKIDSTNIFAKKLASQGEKEGALVIANSQTAGKGRLGRTFLSKKGGVYFSIILKPTTKQDSTLLITVAAAVAVARAIERVSGKKCDIKWVNDIYINQKKVCGILAEGNFNPNGKLNNIILGVGINLFEPKNKFPSWLPLADSVFHKQDGIILKKRKKEQVIIEFLNEFFLLFENLEKKEFLTEYQQRSFLTEKEISFTKNNKTYCGKVIGIDNNANLMVIVEGQTLLLSHGEIQITGMEQLTI